MAVDKRRSLLQTAAHEFATHGYEAASLNRIIGQCTMSKSSFYHFIGSKQALFDAVVTESAAQLGDRLHIPEPADLEGPDYWEQITQVLTRLLTLAATESWSVDLGRLFYLGDVPCTGPASRRRINAAMTTWLVDALAAGRRCGAVRDDLPLELQAELTISTLRITDRWALQHLRAGKPAQSRKALGAAIAPVRRLLEPDPPDTRRRTDL